MAVTRRQPPERQKEGVDEEGGASLTGEEWGKEEGMDEEGGASLAGGQEATHRGHRAGTAE